MAGSNFPDLIRPSDPSLTAITATGKAGLSGSGYEGAHLFGSKFWDDSLGFLSDLANFGISKDSLSNGALQADNQRAGAALQTAVRRAANDDESCACIVGNRRVWWTGESIWGVAA
jgi:hypothetical protein